MRPPRITSSGSTSRSAGGHEDGPRGSGVVNAPSNDRLDEKSRESGGGKRRSRLAARPPTAAPVPAPGPSTAAGSGSRLLAEPCRPWERKEADRGSDCDSCAVSDVALRSSWWRLDHGLGAGDGTLPAAESLSPPTPAAPDRASSKGSSSSAMADGAGASSESSVSDDSLWSSASDSSDDPVSVRTRALPTLPSSTSLPSSCGPSTSPAALAAPPGWEPSKVPAGFTTTAPAGSTVPSAATVSVLSLLSSMATWRVAAAVGAPPPPPAMPPPPPPPVPAAPRWAGRTPWRTGMRGGIGADVDRPRAWPPPSPL